MMRFNRQTIRVDRRWIVAMSAIGVFVLGIAFVSHPALAASTALQTVGTTSGLPTASIGILIARIIRVVLGTLGIITVILVLYGGFLYFTSNGEVEKIKKAKKVLTSTVIGLVIIFSSYSLASWILNKLTEAAYGPGTIASAIQKFGEPFGGSLGSGIIESHYPMRNAVDIPRNTKVFVTFKESIDPSTVIAGYKDGINPPSVKLNADGVKIFKTAEGPGKALTSDQVEVSVDPATKKTFVFSFKPIGYLGGDKPTGYSVFLTPKIQKADKSPAFSGDDAKGYQWSFGVSTNIDLIPPKIESVISAPGSSADRNVTVEITFNEPMDPIAATGVNSAGNAFDHIKVTTVPPIDPKKPNEGIYGSYAISNGYKTVDFTTTDECAKDPCNSKVYCLPGSSAITVNAKAATVDSKNIPQAQLNPDNVSYDGLVDAAGNSLDGSGAADGKGDGIACGSALDLIACPNKALNDDYTWNFATTAVLDLSVPKILSLAPGVNAGSVDLQAPLVITFEKLLQASSVNSQTISLTPDPFYSIWFTDSKADSPAIAPTQSIVSIAHSTFIPASESVNQFYWPVITQGVKGINQFCMYPATGPSCDGSKPFCCNGVGQDQASDCTNSKGQPIHP